MKWFDDCKTIEQLKRKYYALASKYHPDHGGDLETMQAINAEFSEMSKILRNKHETRQGEKKQENETEKESNFNAEKYMDLISKLIHFQGVRIEICGTWIWLTGNTYPYREQIRELNFQWSKSKKAWYYAEGLFHKKSRGTKTLNQIRNEFGSEVINSKPFVSLN